MAMSGVSENGLLSLQYFYHLLPVTLTLFVSRVHCMLVNKLYECLLNRSICKELYDCDVIFTSFSKA